MWIMWKLQRRLRFYSLCGLLACLVAVGGCAEKDSGVEVSGQIIQDGQPLEINEQAGVIMGFYELRDGKLGERSYTASVEKSGAYRVALPPGNYRVSVELMDPYVEHVDKFGGAYDQMNSPITVEITESQENLDIKL